MEGVATSATVYSGWVWKRGAIVRNWKHRFLALRRSGRLFYFKAEWPFGNDGSDGGAAGVAKGV